MKASNVPDGLGQSSQQQMPGEVCTSHSREARSSPPQSLASILRPSAQPTIGGEDFGNASLLDDFEQSKECISSHSTPKTVQPDSIPILMQQLRHPQVWRFNIHYHNDFRAILTGLRQELFIPTIPPTDNLQLLQTTPEPPAWEPDAYPRFTHTTREVFDDASDLDVQPSIPTITTRPHLPRFPPTVPNRPHHRVQADEHLLLSGNTWTGDGFHPSPAEEIERIDFGVGEVIEGREIPGEFVPLDELDSNFEHLSRVNARVNSERPAGRPWLRRFLGSVRRRFGMMRRREF